MSSSTGPTCSTSAGDDVAILLGAKNVLDLADNLKKLAKRNVLRVFHATSFLNGHASTKTERWLERVCSSKTASVLNAGSLDHNEGWEPYGIMSLKIMQRVGGFNRCFVGWHKDKIEFIRRLSFWGIKFDIIFDARAFVLDWKPHEVCDTRRLTMNCEFYKAANEGLYMRTLNQMKMIHELSVEEAWRLATSPITTAESRQANTDKEFSCLTPEPMFSSLRTVLWSSSEMLASDNTGELSRENLHSAHCLRSNESVKLLINEKTRSQLGRGTARGVLAYSMSADVLLPPVRGLSFRIRAFDSTQSKSEHSNEHPYYLKTVTALGVSYKVKFPSSFDWGQKGGTLPGLEIDCFEKTPSSIRTYFPPPCVARFHWLNNGGLKFKISATGETAKHISEFIIGLNKTTQLHRDCWHVLSVSAWQDGRIFAFLDNHPVFSSYYKYAFRSLNDVVMRVVSERAVRDDTDQESIVELKDVVVAGNIDSAPEDNQQCPVPRNMKILSSSLITKQIIANNLTVVFAPKETHSTACTTLKRFLSESAPVAGLVIVIAPPVHKSIIDELISIAHELAGANCVISTYNTVDYENPYAVRNSIASDVRTKYVLHLNNDVVSVDGFSSNWLVSLVDFAESNPHYWVVLPLLLEKNLDGRYLHVWWDETSLVMDNEDESAPPKFRARHNNFLTQLSVDDIQWHIQHRNKPLLFVEDHVILARTVFFVEEPLFDPMACYRREFFDLAWGIRSRGGDFGMDISAVVMYEKVQPLHLYDIPYFIQRRQDVLCFMSQAYLNHKWGIDYEMDSWQDEQVDKALKNLNIDVRSMQGGNLGFLGHIELIISLLVAAGMSEFRCDTTSSCDDLGKEGRFHHFLDMKETMLLIKEKISDICNSNCRVLFKMTDSINLYPRDSFQNIKSTKSLLLLRGINVVKGYSTTGMRDCPSKPSLVSKQAVLFKISWSISYENVTSYTSSSGYLSWEYILEKNFSTDGCRVQQKKRFMEIFIPFLLIRYDSNSSKHPAIMAQVSFEAWFWVRPSASANRYYDSGDIYFDEWSKSVSCVLQSLKERIVHAEVDLLDSFDISRHFEIDSSNCTLVPTFVQVDHLSYAMLTLSILKEGLKLIVAMNADS